MLHRQHDSLDQLLNLLIKTTDVRVRFCRSLVYFHRLDPRIVLGRQGVENKIGVLLDTDQIARLQGCWVN